MSLFGRNKTISSVKLLGTRTGQETRILATYNFTVYIFWIQYTDGSTENVEISSSDGTQKQRLKMLLQMANMQDSMQPKPSISEETNSRGRSEVYADLKNIKDLYDAQIMPEEVFVSEKDRLLKELEQFTKNDTKEKKPEYNLIINRNKKRPFGESKIVVTIDGKKRNDIDTDVECKMNLSEGEHTIVINRAALKCKEIISIDNSHVCSIMIFPEMLTLNMSVKYI